MHDTDNLKIGLPEDITLTQGICDETPVRESTTSPILDEDQPVTTLGSNTSDDPPTPPSIQEI